MGWYGTYTTREAAEAEALKTRFLVDKVRLAEWTWAVIAPGGEFKPYILLVLFQRIEGGWFYKMLDESMHPFFYDCPAHLFELAPDAHGDMSARWRAQCRELHTREEASRKLGAYT